MEVILGIRSQSTSTLRLLIKNESLRSFISKIGIWNIRGVVGIHDESRSVSIFHRPSYIFKQTRLPEINY